MAATDEALTPNATQIQDIPEELLYKEILPRLPVHSIFQASFVCTKWRFLIKQNQNPICLILLDWRRNEVYYISDVETSDKAIKLTRFPIPAENEDGFPWLMVGSVNGLNCFQLGHEKRFIVFNPVNGDFICIPFPCRWIFHFGFGWDQKTNRYKLVVMHPCDRPNEMEVQIHTLGSNTWKSMGTVPNNITWEDSCGVLLHGHLHWIVMCNHPEDPTVLGIRVVHVEDESLGVVSIPSQMKGKIDHQFLRLGVLRGSLMIADSSLSDSLRLWIMKDYGVEESWILDIIISMPPKCRELMPLGVLMNGNVLLGCSTTQARDYNEFSSYDPKTRIHESIRVKGLPPNGFLPYTHVGSLVTLKAAMAMED